MVVDTQESRGNNLDFASVMGCDGVRFYFCARGDGARKSKIISLSLIWLGYFFNICNHWKWVFLGCVAWWRKCRNNVHHRLGFMNLRRGSEFEKMVGVIVLGYWLGKRSKWDLWLNGTGYGCLILRARWWCVHKSKKKNRSVLQVS